MDPFVKVDAMGQAELVRRREVTPLDLVDAAIARIEKLNPTLNAVITPLFEEARAAARSSALPEGPFRGVPFLLKDIGVMQAGQPYYAGNRALRDARYRAPADTYLGARFRAAGLIVLGKTNTPELGAQSTTQPLAFGPTRNPWDLERSTSGSSGGSCAAVAAGLVPIAHANDGGGSIRLPAAWCGLGGLKPSRGRVAFGPTNVSRMGVELVVSRSLRDVAAMLDAVRGNEPGELFLTPPPARRYTEELGVDPGRLRIGILTHAPDLVVHSECIKGTEAAGRLLESLGHSVEPAWPEALFDTDRIHQRTLGLADMRRRIRALQTLLGRPAVESDVEPFLWKLARFDLPPVAAEEYIAASEWQQGWVARVSAWWSKFDLLLSPTVCEPPATLAEMTPPADKPWKLGRRVQEHCSFTQPFNTTGQPAISLPLHWTPEGLPVGVQLVASMGREDLLLRVAAQLEVAHSWSGRRPPVSV